MRASISLQDTEFQRAFSILQDGIERQAFPGAALAVTCRGQLVASRGFGHFTYDSGSREIASDTIFDLASLTKVVVTTTMAMILVECHQLSLDMLLSAILPDFTALAPAHQQARRKSVTIGMLLTHSSGLPAYEKLFEFAHTREELVRSAMTTPLVAAPGSRADYSDIGFILLGEALSKIAGMALDDFAEREIFGPLHMTRSSFVPPLALRPEIPPTEDDRAFRKRVIQGEVNDENAWVMQGVSGHAGVFAPATNLARFAECMLHGGEPILHAETVHLFTSRRQNPPGTSRALGWDTPSQPSSSGSRFSKDSFGHLGFTGTSLWIDPARQLSVTLLTNRTWPHRSSQAIRQIRPLVHDAIVEAIEGHRTP